MLNTDINDDIPPGFKLRHILRGHTEAVNRIAWSSDGQILASSSNDFTIKLWDTMTGQYFQTLRAGLNSSITWSPDGHILAAGAIGSLILWDRDTGQLLRALGGHSSWVLNLLWSPDGQTLASAAKDNIIRLWDIGTGKLLRSLIGHSDEINSLAWSPDGQTLASAAKDNIIKLWDIGTGKLLRSLIGHSDEINSLAWSPDGQTLASAAKDRTILLWRPQTGQEMAILEGHTTDVLCISFFFNGRLLASKSLDGAIRLWNPYTRKMLVVFNEPRSDLWFKRNTGLVFHPKKPVLASFGEGNRIYIWDLNLTTILNVNSSAISLNYTNAKVALVGDTGVGKSGLGLVLSNQEFIPTDSTHGRNVWTFDNQEIEFDDGHKETHETFLWDLAGQPSYRLIHQLHLNEAAIALVVFDACSETDPFKGVYYWDRALRQVQHLQGNIAPTMKKLLVAARLDRGGIRVSRTRIDKLRDDLGFVDYFETSAKEGWGIAELIKVIKETIDWEILPKVTSTELFLNIKDFLISEKETGRQLSTVEDLYHTFLRLDKSLINTEELHAQFETCVGRLESQDLIRRLSFGNLVLLQPELLDIYASALVNAVRDEPDGLGSISEEKAREGDFLMPTKERLTDKGQEKLLLIAMIEDLLRHEIALREHAADGTFLIFPSQSTREKQDLSDPEGKAVVFSFEGPVLNIYATLAVRLSHSGVFRKKELWKDAVTYMTWMGGTCGIFLRNLGEGYGELVLFFDRMASQETRYQFEKYAQIHLERWALPESIKRKSILPLACSKCGESFTEAQIAHRRKIGFSWIQCSVCETRISLLSDDKHVSLVPKMDFAADTQRASEVNASILQGRREVGDFDVFLCHNYQDKPNYGGNTRVHEACCQRVSKAAR